MTIPAFGLGTLWLTGSVLEESVSDALELGYRAIDTAQIYRNEADIGRTIEASGLPRGEVFVTTKIWMDNYAKGKLVPSLRESLDRLRMEQADLTLIHWPLQAGGVPMAEYMEQLAEARELGLTRLIGVSNFTIDLLRQAQDIVGKDAIATNQVEISPYLQNRKLADFAREAGIHLTSFQTLAKGRVVYDTVLLYIAARHGATPAQVALAWAMKRGHAVIPSSTDRRNLESNLQALNLDLSEDDMERISKLDSGRRLANPAAWAPVWD